MLQTYKFKQDNEVCWTGKTDTSTQRELLLKEGINVLDSYVVHEVKISDGLLQEMVRLRGMRYWHLSKYFAKKESALDKESVFKVGDRVGYQPDGTDSRLEEWIEQSGIAPYEVLVITHVESVSIHNSNYAYRFNGKKNWHRGKNFVLISTPTIISEVKEPVEKMDLKAKQDAAAQIEGAMLILRVKLLDQIKTEAFRIVGNQANVLLGKDTANAFKNGNAQWLQTSGNNHWVNQLALLKRANDEIEVKIFDDGRSIYLLVQLILQDLVMIYKELIQHPTYE